jgi:hypothetical protein
MRQNELNGSNAYKGGWMSFHGVIDENSASPLYRQICTSGYRIRHTSISFDNTSYTPTPIVSSGGVTYRMKFTFYFYGDTTPSFTGIYNYDNYHDQSPQPSNDNSDYLGSTVIYTGYNENLRYTSYKVSDSAMTFQDISINAGKCLSCYYKMEMFGSNNSITDVDFNGIGSEFTLNISAQQVD